MINLPKKDYGNLENKVLRIFSVGTNFKYGGNYYKVLISDKPKTQRGGGEPKNDVFIRGESLKSKNILDLKITIKMDMANIFVENKITPERFNEIFIIETKKKISNCLYDEVFPQILEKTRSINESKRFPLGWKCEIALNDTRRNRVRVIVTPEEAEEIYTGKKRPERFKDALINGQIIKNSGIPDFILSTLEHKINSPHDVISQLIPISNYIAKEENRVFDIILTGLGLFVKNEKNRFFKWDGNRPLLIGVNWVYTERGLQGLVDLENLFRFRGNEMANQLKNTCIEAKIPMNSVSKFWSEFQKKVACEQLIIGTEVSYKSDFVQKKLSDFKN